MGHRNKKLVLGCAEVGYILFSVAAERLVTFLHPASFYVFHCCCGGFFFLFLFSPLTLSLIIPCQVCLRFTREFKSTYETLIDGPTRLSKQLKKMRLKLKIIISEIDKKEGGWKAF